MNRPNVTLPPPANSHPTSRKAWGMGAAALALCLGLALSPPAAEAVTTGGAATVQGFYDTLLNTMHNGPQLGSRGRYNRLAPVVQRVFDVPLMTRLAVGPTWSSLSAAQRAAVTEAFGRYISATYADRFDSYSGERLQVLGQQSTPTGVVIQTRIVKSNGDPVAINYLVRQNGASWQIADVYLDGTISELATQRAEFAAILRSRGVDGLIATLNRKAETLASARSS